MKEDRDLKKMSFLIKYVYFCLSFKGRLNRKSFALFNLELFGIVASIVAFCFSIGVIMIGFKAEEGKIFMVMALGAAFIIGGFIVCIAGSSAIIRRLHDLNLSGWWILLLLPLYFDGSRAIKILPAFAKGVKTSPAVDLIIAVVGFIMMIGLAFVLWFIKGTRGENQYGPDLLQMEKSYVPRIPKEVLLTLIWTIPPLIFIFYKALTLKS